MTDEESRLAEIKAYQILDTPPEKELDELAEIASFVCDVPISLITIVDKDRQWFKANKGLNSIQTARKDSFCQHALHKPEEILVVNDSLKDPRFKDNLLVKSDPNIRFYAGAPLVTPKGNALGTLCVIDRKPRTITPNQKSVLKLLAKKAMDYLNTRKLLIQQNNTIETSAKKLKKLTDNVPGGIFQLKMTPEGKMSFDFLSSGMKTLHPTLDLEEWKNSPEIGFALMHPEDVLPLQQSMEDSFKNLTLLYHEYRVEENDSYKWHLIKAEPERLKNGNVVWYGSFQDITHKIEYEKAMEQIAFDISHILRRPVTSLLGLSQLIDKDKGIKKSELKEYVGYIKTMSKELNEFTSELNAIYDKKREQIVSRNVP